MRRPTAIELLAAWERALPQSPARRALTLFALARPGEPVAELAARSVGERDAALLELHERLFGSGPALTECPVCAETLEFGIPFAELRAASRAAPNRLTITDDAVTLGFRPPIALDLAALPDGLDLPSARRWLASRCVARDHGDGVPDEPPTLSESAVEAISQRLAETDALGDLQFELVCPACRCEWPAPFDAGSFFWLALEAWARRQLREIHRLASAYGWSEGDILALSPERRRAYLELITE